MSLDFNYSKCVPEVKARFQEQDGWGWNICTATMSTGINKITEANVEEFWDRYCAMQYASGYGTYVNVEDIQLCVGLTTNASTMTPTQFKKKLAERLLENATRLVTHHNAQ